jgi:cysteine-rich repeat protein
MTSTRFAWFVSACLGLTGCGGDDVPPTPADGGAGDAQARVCARDIDCADDFFCNGAERCAPEVAGADARGCIAADGPACLDMQTCDEALDRCQSDCDLASDADGDGHDAMSCGGDDCDDADPNRYPGNSEVCDTEGHDEDCDPGTLGGRDADGDGAIDRLCCNGDDCGTDCDDTRPNVHPMTSEVCDGFDNDCDDNTDEGVLVTYYPDEDMDIYGDPTMPVTGCVPPTGYSTLGSDCDDGDPSVIPGVRQCTGATEARVCNSTGTWLTMTCSGATPVCDSRSGMCSAGACGDGTTQPGEECDDANTAPLDACDNSCRLVPGTTRPISPASGSAVRSLRPTFRVDTASRAASYEIGLFNTRGCTGTPSRVFEIASPSGAPTIDLPRGRTWWCARAVSSSGARGRWSLSWPLRLGYQKGDFNGDGRADPVAGEPEYLVSGYTCGRVSVRQSGTIRYLRGCPGGVLGEDYFGESLTTGDLNGDGLEDLVVGVGLWGGDDRGRVYIYFGSATPLDMTTPVMLTGPSAEYRLGRSVTIPGDINGDGYDDLLVMTSRDSTSPIDLYLGGNPMNPTVDRVGIAVAAVQSGTMGGGDINGDGLADFVVASRRTPSLTSISTGRLDLYLGTPSVTAASFDAPDYANMQGTSGSYMGSAVAVGDIDGDGYQDIAVGAPGWFGATPPASYNGYVFIWRGRSPFSPVRAQIGPVTTQYFGSAVDAGEDFTGDGIGDLVVGARYRSSSAGTRLGAVYMYSGGSIPPIGVGAFTGTTMSENLGASVALMGDYDATGVTSEIHVGSPGYSSSNGRAQVLRYASGSATVVSTMSGAAGGGLLGLTCGP